MITVKLTCNADLPEYPFIRQTPGRRGVWGDCHFLINTPLEECDWWIVLDDLPRTESVRCPPHNTIFFDGEPPTVKTYDERFLRQFATIVTCDKKTHHPQAIQAQQALFWSHQYMMADTAPNSELACRGYKDYDELSRLKQEKKTLMLSLVTSDKAFTPGHRQRLAFARWLKEQMGDQLHLFGRGIDNFEDKWTVTAPYKYHIALENSQFPDYWTEKLADPLLFDCHPFYFGCPNVFDYFPQDALTVIDISDFDKSLAVIRSSIEDDLHEKSILARQESKRLILNKYNLFPTIASMIAQAPVFSSKKVVTLKPHTSYRDVLSLGKAALKRLAKGAKL